MRDDQYQTATPDLSRRTDGEAAAENMNPAGDILSLLSQTHTRLTKVEADNAQVRKELDDARNRGDVDLDLAHVNHVMQKFFPHDRPEADAPVPMVPKFDPYTGRPLN